MSKRKEIARTALDEVDKSGKFVRTASAYKNIISLENPHFKPEQARYHLYASYACPWAHRCLITRSLKGLDNVIGLSIVHPTWQFTRQNNPEDKHSGWVFRAPEDPPVIPISGVGSIPCESCIPDTCSKAQSIRDIYEMSDDSYGKYTVPVLWDTKTKQIVNNESSDILRMFNAYTPALLVNFVDLYPLTLRGIIDETNDWVYTKINNGVYKCGFATTQSAYDEAINQLYEGLDKVESILSNQRYICSDDQITEADIRLYVTLVRFDEVYVVYFKCNKKQIREYPHTMKYLQSLYRIPAFKETTNMQHIKAHYFTSHSHLNSHSIIPKGPGFLEILENFTN